ncbi:periplasmic amidohydrolase [Thermaurantimonas aggregans]|uniref:Periplasmic amidohydrolase n=1 Tax=Thermaurantimonas aggregans TaxID=2173829 RepID=A0A401XI83_9FLAO|nr:amidohydrolase family protein [Thermaurantimonas aggregans]GCD76711.1 periplasmic amidohydrolase [Thermaurantimonas aggregans]
MTIRQILWQLVLVIAWLTGTAQIQQPIGGITETDELTVVYTNALVITEPGAAPEKLNIAVRKGKIIRVSAQPPQPGEVVVDCNGMYIYPGFIDLVSQYGIEAEPASTSPSRRRTSSQPIQYDRQRTGARHWNDAIRSEYHSYEDFEYSKKEAEEWQKAGFTAVLSHRNDGIARGSGSLVLTGNGRENQLMLRERASMHYSFSKGSSKQPYPTSLMGAIALLRQLYSDADWYRKGGRDGEINLAIAAEAAALGLPMLFETRDLYDLWRASELGKPFNRSFILYGTGREYQRAKEIKQMNTKLILPMTLPKVPDVSSPYDHRHLTWEKLAHWEMAPFNPFVLRKEGVEFAFTTKGLKNKTELWKSIAEFLKSGLDTTYALAALTTVPANMINASDVLGKIKPGYAAAFIGLEKPFGDANNKVLLHVSYATNIYDPIIKPSAGVYEVKMADSTAKLLIYSTPTKPKIKWATKDTTDVEYTLSLYSISLRIPINKKEKKYRVLEGTFTPSSISGQYLDEGARLQNWSATRVSDLPDTAQKKNDSIQPLPGYMKYPFTAWGLDKPAEQEFLHIKGATLWTSERDGKLENADIIIRNGKIQAIGTYLRTPAGAAVWEAKGLHVTPGIIDEHSHIAISRGVNEGSHSITSEVRIGDVLNPDDINIYRQLAGGVTAAQLLHGSANAIGGQNALIKLRWGALPDEMKMAGASGFIKFALGENVKQSNWGDQAVTRFPQTRMGVEQVYADAFNRAKEYEARKKAAAKAKIPFRTDYQLEALVEILNGTRHITCHSYVQSEINMLMKLADSLGFKVNTFTHILEGYKVADKMKAHGANASSFSDWWAYKWEVKEAIPFNAAILHRVGVNTAINSDDAEMGRRLNQEAAKVVKYGGLPETEALAMVTINPARMLHIDHLTGSLKVGKDADIVVWSGHPLLSSSYPLATFVDGKRLYDYTAQKAKEEAIRAEKNRLIQKALAAIASGKEKESIKPDANFMYHCETIIQYDAHENE